MFAFFIELKKNNTEEECCNLLQTYDITKLDINRIIRYIERYNQNDIKLSKNIYNDFDNEEINNIYE
jgi:hypothetical protein